MQRPDQAYTWQLPEEKDHVLEHVDQFSKPKTVTDLFPEDKGW
jgi:hypothetical protein